MDYDFDEPLELGDEWNRASDTDYKLLISYELSHTDENSQVTSDIILREIFNSYLNDYEYKTLSTKDLDKRFKLNIDDNWNIKSNVQIIIEGNITGNQIKELLDLEAEDDREDRGFITLWDGDQLDVMSETDIKSGILTAEITNLNQNTLDLYPNAETKIKLSLSEDEIVSILNEIIPWESHVYLYLERETEADW